MRAQVLAGKGPRLVLELPAAAFAPGLAPYIAARMRHILEDPATLQVCCIDKGVLVSYVMSSGQLPLLAAHTKQRRLLQWMAFTMTWHDDADISHACRTAMRCVKSQRNLCMPFVDSVT